MHTLTTARLRLARWQQRFEPDLLRLSSDPSVMRYIGNGRPWDLDVATQRHQAHLAHWQQHGFGWRAILGDDDAFLGIAALNEALRVYALERAAWQQSPR